MCSQQVGKDRAASGGRGSRKGKAGRFLFPSAFHYLLFPINMSISGVSSRRRLNGNESRASCRVFGCHQRDAFSGRTHAKLPSQLAGAVSGRRLTTSSGCSSLARPDYTVGDLICEAFIFVFVCVLLFVFYAGWVGNVWREMKGEGEINTESKHARRGKAGRIMHQTDGWENFE